MPTRCDEAIFLLLGHRMCEVLEHDAEVHTQRLYLTGRGDEAECFSYVTPRARKVVKEYRRLRFWMKPVVRVFAKGIKKVEYSVYPVSHGYGDGTRALLNYAAFPLGDWYRLCTFGYT